MARATGSIAITTSKTMKSHVEYRKGKLVKAQEKTQKKCLEKSF